MDEKEHLVSFTELEIDSIKAAAKKTIKACHHEEEMEPDNIGGKIYWDILVENLTKVPAKLEIN